jgi:uncharacterized protein YgbK (DUF1537 family)
MTASSPGAVTSETLSLDGTAEIIRDRARRRPLIVLDDDPTGTQTVRDVTVLTSWTEARLRDVFLSGAPATYLLTNSRSLPRSDAVALARSIGRSLTRASIAAGTTFSVVSRSDSTLRGHFPAEVDALAEGLGLAGFRVLLAPFFGAGGRITRHGIHYLRREGRDIPVAETEFARDPVFGYRSSDLREWVTERTGDPDRTVELVALDVLRHRGPTAVTQALLSLPARGVLVVDAVEETDIEIAALGALEAEKVGLALIARTAASYARARAGQPPERTLDDGEIEHGAPGLVVVGSHVPTTSRQLGSLMDAPPTRLMPIEVVVGDVLADPASRRRVAESVATRADAALADGTTPVIHTSRSLAHGSSPGEDLEIAKTVSTALVEIVQRIRSRPAWVLAKGGITSSDVATRGLAMTEATVLGTIVTGVPVWRSGPGSRWPGSTFVVFPGNVGGPTAVRDAIARLVGGR